MALSDGVEKELINNYIRAAIDEVQSLVTHLSYSPRRDLQNRVAGFEVILGQLNDRLED